MSMIYDRAEAEETEYLNEKYTNKQISKAKQKERQRIIDIIEKEKQTILNHRRSCPAWEIIHVIIVKCFGYLVMKI